MAICGEMGCVTSNNRLHFGRDLGQDADTGFFLKIFFSIWDMGIAELYINELSGSDGS